MPVSFAGRNLRNGRWYSEYEILWGGYVARPTKDGISGMSQDSSTVLNSPVESIESEFPMMIECYEIIPDSGGAGKFRGGLGVRRNWKVLGESVILNLRSDRFKFSSPGIFGALPARPSRCLLNPGTSQEIRLTSKQTNVQLKRGDVVSLELAGGGGWGKPEERDPKLVLKDVIEGDVSLEQAREVYKVWIDPDTFSINEKATESLRKGGGSGY
ncbi:MAG: hydantoinase B/oxoprolinase family protein [Deltaproteobacteria bacterium]